jgi:hypothetical protein
VAENKEVPDSNIGVPPVRKYANYLPFKLLGQNSTQGLEITEEKVLPSHCAIDINKWLDFRVFSDKDVTVKS